MTTSPPSRLPGRLLMLLGLALAPLGIVAYLVQFKAQRLRVPWYMPGLAFLGAVLIGASLWEKRTVWRMLALLAVVVLGGFELMALNALRLPRYSGPVAVGRPFPAFAARLADGAPFTQASLPGPRNSVLVFFRGRW